MAKGDDYGPAEAAQHAPRIVEQLEQAGHKRVRVLDLIEQWATAEPPLIDSAQRSAASEFQQNFYDAGFVISCERREKVDGGTRQDVSYRATLARQNITKLSKLMDDFQFFALWYVVGEGMGLEEACRRWSYRGRLPRSPKTLRKRIIEALEIAAKFYSYAG